MPAEPVPPLPSPAIPAPFSNNIDDQFATVYGYIQDIREEVLYIQESLKQIEETSTITDDEARKRELEQRFLISKRRFTEDGGQINTHIAALEGLKLRIPTFYYKIGDIITRIGNKWVSVEQLLPTDERPFDSERIIAWAKEANKKLDEVVYNCGLITIPVRLNEHLATLHVGQPLDFRTNFEDELPRDDLRRRFLEYIAAHPVSIQGVVEIEKGIIFKASLDWKRRYISILLIVATVLLGIGIVAIFSNTGAWLNLDNWLGSPSRFRGFLGIYIFIVIGAFVHIVVDAVKQARTPGSQNIKALEQWLIWFHIKEVPIIVGVISLWIGFFILIYTDSNADWVKAFFVGYSIDSIIDVGLQRFTSIVSAQNEGVVQTVGGLSA